MCEGFDEEAKLFLKEIGVLIRRIRLNKNITEGELAKRCHMDVMTVSFIERGISNMYMDSFLTICKGLEVAPEYVLGMRSKEAEDNILRLSEQFIKDRKQIEQGETINPKRKRVKRK